MVTKCLGIGLDVTTRLGQNWEIGLGAHKLCDASRVYIQEGVELKKVTWDSSKVLWDVEKPVKKQLFQYTIKNGQNIIQQHGIHKDALWREEGLDDTCMQSYWRMLWAVDLLEKYKSFL